MTTDEIEQMMQSFAFRNCNLRNDFVQMLQGRLTEG
jgi:hypothetical protein